MRSSMLQSAVGVPSGAVHDGAGIDWLGNCAWAVGNGQGGRLEQSMLALSWTNLVTFFPPKRRDQNELTSVTV